MANFKFSIDPCKKSDINERFAFGVGGKLRVNSANYIGLVIIQIFLLSQSYSNRLGAVNHLDEPHFPDGSLIHIFWRRSPAVWSSLYSAFSGMNELSIWVFIISVGFILLSHSTNIWRTDRRPQRTAARRTETDVYTDLNTLSTYCNPRGWPKNHRSTEWQRLSSMDTTITSAIAHDVTFYRENLVRIWCNHLVNFLYWLTSLYFSPGLLVAIAIGAVVGIVVGCIFLLTVFTFRKRLVDFDLLLAIAYFSKYLRFKHFSSRQPTTNRTDRSLYSKFSFSFKL
jgi:hypothetical protein